MVRGGLWVRLFSQIKQQAAHGVMDLGFFFFQLCDVAKTGDYP